MLLTLVLWLCTLPVLLAIAPFFLGWRVSLYLSGIVLIAELLLCWGVCWFPATRNVLRGTDDDQRRH
jgi:hypothetical protein